MVTQSSDLYKLLIEVQRQIGDMGSHVEELSGRQDRLNDRIETLKATVESMEATIRMVTSDTEEIEAELEQAKTLIAAAQVQLTAHAKPLEEFAKQKTIIEWLRDHREMILMFILSVALLMSVLDLPKFIAEAVAKRLMGGH